MSFGWIPSRRMPISDVAPQSIRKVEAAACTWNEVCRRPPAPKASPQPIMVTRMGRDLILVSARSESKRTVRDFRR